MAGASARVAISQQRSTRGREILSGIGFEELNTNRVGSVRTFLRAMSKVELTFNWFYADDRDIAMFSSGRIPIEAPEQLMGLPVPGTGEYEWRGFLPASKHVQAIDPPSGAVMNWNNKPGRGFPRRTTTGPTARCSAPTCLTRASRRGGSTPSRASSR
ncbi:MAG TPA: penicillin acylase family protein [Gaiellaceae bacterium]|nr:penicillin acylase family protein [Gaiellaceae bacterium]